LKEGKPAVLLAITEDEDTFEGANDLAKELEGLVRVAVINSKESKNLLENKKVKSDSKFLAKPLGEDEEYQSFDTVEEAKQVCVDSIPVDSIPNLKAFGEIEQFLNTVVRTKKLPMLLFHDKEEIPQLLTKLSLWTEDHISIASVGKPTEDIMKNLQVTETPTIMVMIPQDQGGGKVGFSAAKYDKAQWKKISFKNVMKFVQAVAQEMQGKGFFEEPEKAQKTKEDAKSERSRKKATEAFKAVELFEYTAETPQACTDGKLGLCVIGIVDAQPMNQDDKNAQLAVLKEVQELSYLKDRILHFMWVDLTCHPSFGEHFGIRSENLPAVIAVSPKKQAYAQHVGAFETKKIGSFIGGVLGGKKRISKLPGDGLVPLISEDEATCKTIHDALIPIKEEEDDEDMEAMLKEMEEERLKAEAEAANEEEEDVFDAELALKKERAALEAERMNKMSNKKTKKKKKKNKKKKKSSKKKQEL